MSNVVFALAVKFHHIVGLTALLPKDAVMLQEQPFASVFRVMEQAEGF